MSKQPKSKEEILQDILKDVAAFKSAVARCRYEISKELGQNLEGSLQAAADWFFEERGTPLSPIKVHKFFDIAEQHLKAVQQALVVVQRAPTKANVEALMREVTRAHEDTTQYTRNIYDVSEELAALEAQDNQWYKLTTAVTRFFEDLGARLKALFLPSKKEDKAFKEALNKNIKVQGMIYDTTTTMYASFGKQITDIEKVTQSVRDHAMQTAKDISKKSKKLDADTTAMLDARQEARELRSRSKIQPPLEIRQASLSQEREEEQRRLQKNRQRQALEQQQQTEEQERKQRQEKRKEHRQQKHEEIRRKWFPKGGSKSGKT